MVISNFLCGPRNWQIETARTIDREMRQRHELASEFQAESAATRSDRMIRQRPAYSRMAMAIVARAKASSPMHFSGVLGPRR